MAKPLLPCPAVPWYILAYWHARELITWPAQARRLRRAGFRRTGWMTWTHSGGGGNRG